MQIRIATPEEIRTIGRLSVRLGNVPFLPGQAIVAVMTRDRVTLNATDSKRFGDGQTEPDFDQDEQILGFAAVQNALHAAGSWVKEEFRRKGHSYELRNCLDNELRRRGFSVYFALPGSDFEKHLFTKYGQVTDHPAQIRHL